MNFSPSACADALLEVVPMIMRAMRAEVRRHGAPEMSVPQFRALAFIGRNEGAALSDLAAFLGLTLPSASKLVDGLVAAKFIGRVTHADDRRRVALTLSAAGRRKYEIIVGQARDLFAQRVAALSTPERQRLIQSMALLRQLFAHDQPSEVAARAPRPSATASARVSSRRNHHAATTPR